MRAATEWVCLDAVAPSADEDDRVAAEPEDPGRDPAGRPRRYRPLAPRLGAIASLLLLTAIVSIGATLWVTWHLEGGAAAVNEAGRMRMQAWRIAQGLPARQPAVLSAQLDQFDRSLQLLRDGDPVRPLFVPEDDASRAALAEVEARWLALRAHWSGRPDVDGEAIALETQAFTDTVDQFVGSIERQLSTWTTFLNTLQLLMVGLAIVSALALLLAAQLMVFGPLARLRTALGHVERGDLSARVDEARADEFGTLVDGFNQMADKLQALYATLEQRVREKTESLSAERRRLAALYEAAALVTRADSLDELGRGFVGQMRRVAAADAAAIRWSDESNRRYVMLAAEGLPDALVEAEHCIPAGDCHCGQPRETARVRVVRLDDMAGPSDRALAAVPDCRLSGFRAVVGVPARLHERLVGEVELFYREPVVIAEDDRTLLETLATHLAGAIEGLRADALQREAAIAEERGLLARELHDSIAQSLSFLRIQASLLREELARADTSRVGHTLDELDAGIRESVGDVRELLLHFRTRTNAEDIAPALRTTLTKFEQQTGLSTCLEIRGEGMPLAPDVQIQVLHIVQEALSNVRKHARASTVWIEVVQSPQWIVRVRDDGCGLDVGSPAADETHVGLRIMAERAANIGATFELASLPGEGTQVTLTLPRSDPLGLREARRATVAPGEETVG